MFPTVCASQSLETLGLAPFQQRFPWLGPDLQTLRNTLRPAKPPPETGQTLKFSLSDGDCLLARLDSPGPSQPLGLVVVVHGLGGGSDDEGQRRLARALRQAGFAVLRLNLRGAGPGRPLARGTYAANCSSDLLPVLRECRQLASDLAPATGRLPLAAVGLSLGGTVLLNAQLEAECRDQPLLDALVCVSSPLDLASCADRFEHPRNWIYHRWLVERLIQQTLADPHGLSDRERQGLRGASKPKTIRAFDALITAPRWGFAGVMAYYKACSPLLRLRQAVQDLPPLLLVHAKDDPWVPVDFLLALAAEIGSVSRNGNKIARAGRLPEVWIPPCGGHNGFHAPGDTSQGCWSDRLAALWLARELSAGF